MQYNFEKPTDAYKEIPRFRHEKGAAPFPPYVTFQLVDQCNFKCIMCPRTYIESTSTHLDLDLFKKCIDEIAVHGSLVRFIGFDEPLLYRHIKEAITYVKSKKLMLHITTNGSLMNPSMREHIIKEKVDSMIFSFQGLSADEYCTMRAVPHSMYEKVMGNIRALHAERKEGLPYLKLTTTITNRDQPHQEQSFRAEHGSYLDEIQVTGFTHFVQVDEYFGKGSIWDQLKVERPVLVQGKKCFYPNYDMIVRANGGIYPCCGSFTEEMKVGNVGLNTLQEIWDSTELGQLRARTCSGDLEHYSDCKYCPIRYEDKEIKNPVL